MKKYSIDTKKYINKLIEACKKSKVNLDLKNPKTIQDKLAWLNIYEPDTLKCDCADKVKVHEYCKEKLGKDLCIPILKVYNSTKEIKFDELPDKFVLKCNHGSGMNIVVRDKSKLDKKDAIEKLNKWMSRDFAFQNGFEAHYHDIKKKIFAEKYMNDGHDSLFDYKLWCFNGEPKFYTINDRHEHGRWMHYYDMNQKKTTIVRPDFADEPPFEVQQPKHFKEMVEYAKKLAEPFKFVRVDFYEIDDKVYLGELTFTPAAFRFHYINKEDEIKVGNMLKL